MSVTSSEPAAEIAFTVRSMELRDYREKHGCIVVGPVDGSKLLVRLVPPIPSWVYKTMPEEMDQIVLAPRSVGKSLVPVISEWPFHANICVSKPEGSWTSGPWSFLDIGLLERVEAGA